MSKTKVFSLFFGLVSLAGIAQESAEIKEQITQLPKLSYLDSIKATFVGHETSNCIDEMWMKELSNQELFNDMQSDINKANSNEAVSYDLNTELLKERLEKLNQKSPFNVEYNPTIEGVIKGFLKNRPRAFERLMALSEYYFPMFESKLSKYDLPLEIKYLAIVESALNPLAKSRVGASGLWQFMYETGKQYNLEVNSYVDERYDPLKATEAACQYFTNMYKIFGDWDLVLASYNTGPGNISKAIRRSGGQTNYWNIRKYMHQETQGYLPAFYATMYIYEYKKEHGIVPKRATMTYFETDTVMVKKQMSFKQLSDLLDMPEEQLRFLNPIYKRDVVPFVTDKAHFIRLPKNKLAVFTSNEDKVYAYINYEDSKREKQIFKVKKPRTIVSDSIPTAVASTNVSNSAEEDNEEVTSKPVKKLRTKYYTVKRGDNLSEISEKNNVSMADLKKWNKIKGSTVNAGQKLKIQFETNVVVAEKMAKKKKTDTLKVSEPIVKNEEPKTEVTTNEKVYVVQKGDNLTQIATKNNVTIAELKEWNAIDSEGIKAGQELKIKTSEEVVAAVEKAEKKEVKKSTFRERSLEKERMYVVQKGDSLLRISKKHGISVAAIKKLNNIQGDEIRPGQKLKING
ncbi:LysM peptidoglycan-binding domain-containing protein [Flavobacterium sp. SM15]|uniref:LysM peptidoglycan-binding domain-containing protein n=1 Tax=Flavobacterium sp. SM15 TaxID=2908005 RepID=UPI001EDA7D87|nr:LysM peptidoglycan-binding domain-containing protein [Flavobacterium sp. SM15]MCG2610411.1 LysM peptidoglycan-binding domain-containing protein [Flavobacterium sp. SM15]